MHEIILSTCLQYAPIVRQESTRCEPGLPAPLSQVRKPRIAAGELSWSQQPIPQPPTTRVLRASLKLRRWTDTEDGVSCQSEKSRGS